MNVEYNLITLPFGSNKTQTINKISQDNSNIIIIDDIHSSFLGHESQSIQIHGHISQQQHIPYAMNWGEIKRIYEENFITE